MLNQLFGKYNITDTPDLIDNFFTHDSTLNRLKYLIPEGLKKVVKRLLIKKQVRDINAFSELYDLVNGKIYNGDFEDKNKNLNYILASWYLKELDESTEDES